MSARTAQERPPWRTVITAADAVKVFEALEDPQWDFRTVPGIARETGLAPKQVATIIAQHRELTREAALPDRDGQPLFTLAERKPSWREHVTYIEASWSNTIPITYDSPSESISGDPPGKR